MIKTPILFTICGLLTLSVTHAQQTLSLQGVVLQAQQQSPSYYKARSSALNSLYAYRYYVAGRRPQLRLQASNNSSFLGNIESIRQPDGTYAFSRSSYSYTNTSLAADQIVPFTGGQLSVATNLQRNDVFDPFSSVGYLSTPFMINYSQPTLLYNPYRWDARIQPLLYEESKKEYIEALEQTGLQAAGFFFNALVAQQQELILQQNIANTDTLYKAGLSWVRLRKMSCYR
jgi:hypothetical protein